MRSAPGQSPKQLFLGIALLASACIKNRPIKYQADAIAVPAMGRTLKNFLLDPAGATLGSIAMRPGCDGPALRRHGTRRLIFEQEFHGVI